ncbi:hypothetical protein [uncultured Kordia sp.]|uniref:hypothetical protein n=1 Tax=uncultured Kordia sp. TaxID=507699 RepID=UPI002621C3F7|nr:hypothetical protein [uncultured Kordia sp.]
MNKKLTYIYLATLLLLAFGCNTQKESEKEIIPVYSEHIGDTPFDPKLDDVNFKFCDTTNVLHHRGRISYTGGTPAMEKELIEIYKKQPEFESFTGYFFVRFAVNCKNESGRFRWQIVDEDFKETTCIASLKKEIITNVKNLEYWNHPIYKGESHDGYTFLIIKIKNGNILPS